MAKRKIRKSDLTEEEVSAAKKATWFNGPPMPDDFTSPPQLVAEFRNPGLKWDKENWPYEEMYQAIFDVVDYLGFESRRDYFEALKVERHEIWKRGRHG